MFLQLDISVLQHQRKAPEHCAVTWGLHECHIWRHTVTASKLIPDLQVPILVTAMSEALGTTAGRVVESIESSRHT